MDPDEFRTEMEAYRADVESEAHAARDSFLAYQRLQTLYRRFDLEERRLASVVIADWALSEDETKRWDALALIDDFAIASALPALRSLADRLESSDDPGAPYEWAKVNRVIGTLALAADGGA